MEIRLLHGAAIAPYIDDLARLRLTVFREFPYLYDGNLDYEAEYLATYARSGRSLVVLALDGGQVVGASTGLPLVDETPSFSSPSWPRAATRPRSITSANRCCCRPTVARAWGALFHRARVLRPQAGRVRLLRFLRGGAPGRAPAPAGRLQAVARFLAQPRLLHEPSLRTSYSWRDLDEQEQSAKIMSFWLKALPV